MFKSGKTKSLYQDFLNQFSSTRWGQEKSLHSDSPFVYVDSLGIKYLTEYNQLAKNEDDVLGLSVTGSGLIEFLFLE